MLVSVGLVSVAVLLAGGAGIVPATSSASDVNVDDQPLAVSFNGVTMRDRFLFHLVYCCKRITNVKRGRRNQRVINTHTSAPGLYLFQGACDPLGGGCRWVARGYLDITRAWVVL